MRNLLLTGCLFCGPLLLTFCFLNTVAIFYSATAALPVGTIAVIFLIWTLVTSPLLVLGGIAGKNSKAEFQAPVRTTKYPREIPPSPWYRGTLPQMAMAGFLPFSAIYIELYYIFASVWGHRIYTIYSILFVVFIILVIVTAFITVALTYFQLAAEDHEWWWRYVCSSPVPIISVLWVVKYISWVFILHFLQNEIINWYISHFSVQWFSYCLPFNVMNLVFHLTSLYEYFLNLFELDIGSFFSLQTEKTVLVPCGVEKTEVYVRIMDYTSNSPQRWLFVRDLLQFNKVRKHEHTGGFSLPCLSEDQFFLSWCMSRYYIRNCYMHHVSLSDYYMPMVAWYTVAGFWVFPGIFGIWCAFWSTYTSFWCSYQVFPLWWINGYIHICLLLVLLPRKIRYVWFHANLVLLRLHGLHMLWFLSHARDNRIPCISVLCPPYLPFNQMRVEYWMVSLMRPTACSKRNVQPHRWS